jgi:hypothetical protein
MYFDKRYSVYHPGNDVAVERLLRLPGTDFQIIEKACIGGSAMTMRTSESDGYLVVRVVDQPFLVQP